MTITPCPQGCGGYVNTADVVCGSCRRPLNEVTIMEFAWPGACFEWFGPNDHRCRCRRPKGHEGEHDTHNREGCGARGEGSGDIGCDMPRGHAGLHDWELFESTTTTGKPMSNPAAGTPIAITVNGVDHAIPQPADGSTQYGAQLSYDEIVSLARETGKPTVVVYYPEWCLHRRRTVSPGQTCPLIFSMRIHCMHTNNA